MSKFITILSILLFNQALNAGPIINIENPNFRKLITAIPTFQTSEESKEFSSLASEGASKLMYYLEFSGLFSNLDESAYKDLGKKLFAKFENDEVKAAAGEISALKMLGIDMITLGYLKKEKKNYVLELKTFDFNSNKIVLGKRFASEKKTWLIPSLKSYANHLLKVYTGKEGIFNSKITFIGRQTKSSSKQLYICDFDGSNVKQLTRAKLPVLSPSWSTDGRYIVFTAYTDGNPDIFQYDTLNGKVTKLVGDKGLNSGAAFSPKNNLIAYTGSVKGDTEIFIKTPASGTGKLLISGGGLDVAPKFSPDGKWLAYVSGRFGNPHIFRATLNWKSDSDVRVIADRRLTYAGWYNAGPAWSPDSAKIAFAGYDKDIDRFDLFLMNNDGSKLERLTLKTGDNENPSWSPNGELIVFSSNRQGNTNRKGVAQLYIMRKDGSSQRQLKTGLYEATTPNWGPNL